MIAISLSPNTEFDDVLLAIRQLITPWKWRNGKAKSRLKEYFKQQYRTETVELYNSGRSALFELLKAYGIGKDDEVIVQAFTCVAVPNSVLWNGATIKYADIDESYNLTTATIKKVLSSKTKAIIVQHTFGIPAAIDKIVALAHQHGILVIEDCAHALGAMYQGKVLGSWGDASFFSFGRDKVVSSVFGGVAILNPRPGLGEQFQFVSQRLQASQLHLPVARRHWIFQQLLHPIVFALVLPLYQSGIGKVILVFFQKLGWLSFPVYPEEKCGIQPSDFPADYPAALARLALNQLKKLERYNLRRQASAKHYRSLLQKNPDIILPPEIEGSIWLRYPVLVKQPQEVLKQAKEHDMLLGNWYQSVIDPRGVDQKKVEYQADCTKAESVAKQIINLPTLVNDAKVSKVAQWLIEFNQPTKS